MILLVPVCVLSGYFIGYVVAPLAFSDQLHPDFYEHDRELYAGIYGGMFIGGFLYVVFSGLLIFLFVKSLRSS